ncbi:MAG: 6-phosphofructokinase [Candidatus Caldatribacteriota bacterium]|nr:6-phosphofructokinase [Candidatus Caldatribacteriota bacterium]
MKRIAVLSSGGDSSGMNAAIRAVVRTGIFYGLEVFGIEKGYKGLMEGQFFPMELKSVGGIIQRGGTILKTSRSEKFKTKEGLNIALKKLKEFKIDGLIVIGGDGTFRGAQDLNRLGVKTIGIPATIDNDLYKTDMAIGVDTALNTVLEAIDKIKDTASSHQRAFVMEVMGRNSGYLSLMSGIAGGTEAILIPEIDYKLEDVSLKLKDGYHRGKSHCIIIIAEGVGKTYEVAKYLKDKIGFETRVTILGYIQRGGSPSAFDRLLGSRFGVAAVEHIFKGETSKMVGLSGEDIIATDLKTVLSKQKSINKRLYDLASILAK